MILPRRTSPYTEKLESDKALNNNNNNKNVHVLEEAPATTVTTTVTTRRRSWKQRFRRMNRSTETTTTTTDSTSPLVQPIRSSTEPVRSKTSRTTSSDETHNKTRTSSDLASPSPFLCRRYSSSGLLLLPEQVSSSLDTTADSTQDESRQSPPQTPSSQPQPQQTASTPPLATSVGGPDADLLRPDNQPVQILTILQLATRSSSSLTKSSSSQGGCRVVTASPEQFWAVPDTFLLDPTTETDDDDDDEEEKEDDLFHPPSRPEEDLYSSHPSHGSHHHDDDEEEDLVITHTESRELADADSLRHTRPSYEEEQEHEEEPVATPRNVKPLSRTFSFFKNSNNKNNSKNHLKNKPVRTAAAAKSPRSPYQSLPGHSNNNQHKTVHAMDLGAAFSSALEQAKRVRVRRAALKASKMVSLFDKAESEPEDDDDDDEEHDERVLESVGFWNRQQEERAEGNCPNQKETARAAKQEAPTTKPVSMKPLAVRNHNIGLLADTDQEMKESYLDKVESQDLENEPPAVPPTRNVSNTQVPASPSKPAIQEPSSSNTKSLNCVSAMCVKQEEDKGLDLTVDKDKAGSKKTRSPYQTRRPSLEYIQLLDHNVTLEKRQSELSKSTDENSLVQVPQTKSRKSQLCWASVLSGSACTNGGAGGTDPAFLDYPDRT